MWIFLALTIWERKSETQQELRKSYIFQFLLSLGTCQEKWTVLVGGQKKVAQPNTFSMMGNRTNVPRMLPRLVVKKIRKA